VFRVWYSMEKLAVYPDRTAMPWGENILHLTPSYYRVTIPAGLQNGEYMLRHEVSIAQDHMEKRF
jgi:cellulase